MKKKSEKCYCKQDNVQLVTDPSIQEIPGTSKDIYGHPDVSDKSRRGKVRSQDDLVDSSKTNKQISDSQFKNVYEEKSDSVPKTSYSKTSIGKVLSQDYVDSSKANKQISDSQFKKVYSEDKSDFMKKPYKETPSRICTCGRILALDYKPSYNVQYKNNNFFIEIDVNEFTPDGLRVSMTKDLIQIEGVVVQRHDTVDQVCAEFTKTYTIPCEMDPSTISAQFYSNGILVIKADKKKNSSISSDKGMVSTSLPLEKQSSSHIKVEVGKDVECGNCNELRKVPPDSKIIPITEINENYKGFGSKPKDCRCSKINNCIKFV